MQCSSRLNNNKCKQSLKRTSMWSLHSFRKKDLPSVKTLRQIYDSSIAARPPDRVYLIWDGFSSFVLTLEWSTAWASMHKYPHKCTWWFTFAAHMAEKLFIAVGQQFVMLNRWSLVLLQVSLSHSVCIILQGELLSQQKRISLPSMLITCNCWPAFQHFFPS